MKPLSNLLRATSFGRQLGFVVALAVLSLAFASSLATSWQSSRQIRTTLLEQGQRITENLARQSKLALVYDAAENANEAVAVTLSFPDVIALEIHHADGRLLLSRNAKGPTAREHNDKITVQRQQAYLEAESDDAWRFVAPVLAGGGADTPFDLAEPRPETLGYVRVIQSKATLARMRHEVFGVNFAVSFLFAFAFLIVGRRLTARLTRPLDRLSAAMARAEAGAGEVRAEATGPKDIVDMAQAFNKMMAALEGRERELRTLLANLPAAVVVHGPDTAIRYTNPVADAFFGPASGEGTPAWYFVRADGSTMAPDEFPVNLVAADKLPLHDYTVGVVRSPEEPPRWTSVSAFPEIDAGGRLEQVIVCYVEITERKQFEEQLRSLNESLEQRVQEEVAKNREKDAMLIQQSRLATMGEMMHNVAHQWRQPLSALTIILANIKDDFEFGEMSRETLDRQVADGLMLAQKMSSTIDDFRDFFRPDHEKSRFSLGESVREALNLVEASIRNNRVEVEVATNEEVFVEGFANEYSQVLLNVLTNAKDALAPKPDGGRVTISIERKEGQGVVRISDNGGGIAEDVLPKIFDPYFTTKETGTGIGLYMSRMIMSHMHGHIVARNVEGGAEIEITIPAVD